MAPPVSLSLSVWLAGLFGGGRKLSRRPGGSIEAKTFVNLPTEPLTGRSLGPSGPWGQPANQPAGRPARPEQSKADRAVAALMEASHHLLLQSLMFTRAAFRGPIGPATTIHVIPPVVEGACRALLSGRV